MHVKRFIEGTDKPPVDEHVLHEPARRAGEEITILAKIPSLRAVFLSSTNRSAMAASAVVSPPGRSPGHVYQRRRSEEGHRLSTPQTDPRGRLRRMWDAQGMTEDEPKAQQVTRKMLYEQVWAKPIRAVAAEYGISDVGLAKACDRLNVPRPTVGHWVRLEHGRKTERPPLPPAAPGQPTMLLIKPPPSGAARSKEPGAPRPEAPVVVVEDNLRKAHPATRQLQQILRERTPDQHGILIVPGPDGAIFRASKATRDRALRILDALFKALASRGHPVAIDNTPELGYHGGRYRMIATVHGQDVRLSIAERLSQREHVCDPRDGHSRLFEPRFDYSPSGNLVLQVGSRWGRHRTVKDGEKAKLEQLLGRAGLACEAEAAELIHLQAERTRREQAEAEHARLRAIEQARAEHQKLLAADLVAMANSWVTANRIRDFLRAVEDRLPPDGRNEATSAWLAWAHTHVANIDPLHAPQQIAKQLAPRI